MRLSARHRWWVWGALLMGALSLWIWGEPATDAVDAMVVQATRTPGAGVPPASPAPAMPRDRGEESLDQKSTTAPPKRLIPRSELVQSSMRPGHVDLFAGKSWTPVLPPPPPPAPVTPSAPALTYTVLGKLQQAGQWEVYLGQGERSLIAREGGELDGVYQVVKIQPPTMTVRYRPLGQLQQLMIGE